MMRVVQASRSALIPAPKPGERLVETDLATGARTTFIVVPQAGGRESEVTIQSEWEAHGLRGWMEGLIAPRVLGRIYAEQLARLKALFASGSAASTRQGSHDGP